MNAFLEKLGWLEDVTVSSGWRPAEVNAAIPNAAKKSLHMIGLAVDIADPDGALKQAILDDTELLAEFALWLEDPASTPGWCHLDLGIRSARAVRVFKP